MNDRLSPEMTMALQHFNNSDSSPVGKGLKALKEAKTLEKIEATAKDFEAVFVSEMMKPMFEGISTAPPFGGGQAEETFRSLLLQEYGKLISQTGQIGMADHIKNAMIEMQSATNNETATQNSKAGKDKNSE